MHIACPTCHSKLEQKTSRKDKPYFVCESCGVQIFVRFQAGIDRLKSAMTNTLALDDYVVCQGCQVAVRKSSKKISRPLIGKAGLRCPECDELLLKAEEVAAAKK